MLINQFFISQKIVHYLLFLKYKLDAGNWKFDAGFEFQTSNIKHQTSNIKHQTSNIKHQTSNIKHQTSNIKHQTSSLLPRLFLLIRFMSLKQIADAISFFK